jgi:hypothetical protein
MSLGVVRRRLDRDASSASKLEHKNRGGEGRKGLSPLEQTLHNAGRLRTREANGTIIDEHGHRYLQHASEQTHVQGHQDLDAIDVTARYFVYKLYDY